MGDHIIAVDVGTGSARAGLFDLNGRQRARIVTPISLNQPEPRYYEQDSEEIWRAVIQSVRTARDEAGLAPEDIAAIGFDATCSLVVRGARGEPLTVSKSGVANLDTMLWMDHRAVDEAEECSRSGDPLLERFGDRILPEMQAPKLMWLKRHLPDSWSQAGRIFDLCDYLTWRATGSNERSHSSLSSKWGYFPQAPGARPDDFYQRMGLSDLAARAALPDKSYPPMRPLGVLSAEAATELGLTTRCIVAPGLIDAYAGAIGMFAGARPENFANQAALVAGTSSCILTLSSEPVSHTGCWGGFRDAALPGLWLLEAGQSASGALLDHILRMHPAGGRPTSPLHLSVLDHIAARIDTMGHDYGLPITVLPDFHGARSPLADARLTGALSGLSLDGGFDGLCRLYWRACVALACGVKQILADMPDGAKVDTLLMTGGFANHPVIPALYANITGRAIRRYNSEDAVLLGCALNAGVAADLLPSHAALYENLFARTQTVSPQPSQMQAHARDYDAYLAMQRHRDELRAILDPRP